MHRMWIGIVFVKCANWLGQWGFIVKVKNASAPVSFCVQ